MSPAVQSASLGIAFAVGAAMLCVAYFRLALARHRSAHLVVLGMFAVFLVIGPFGITQLSLLQFRAGITDPQARDVGAHIYVTALIALGVFALVQIARYNKRNRQSRPPTA